ncbi:MAG: arsenate reductase ArsC [Zetaproteobacteria bacterium]|nr:MAG: arsenate reductase ArsC [Zetaproteobacteria bacterium]
MNRPVKVMFVCTGNSARSQMAEGFARYLGGGRVEAHSAGVEPSRLNPVAVAVMREKGIDISGQHSKAFDWERARQMDAVVTVCGHANETCPVLPPEVKRLHWPLEDPAAATGSEDAISATFRRIRDQVEVRVLDLLRTLP